MVGSVTIGDAQLHLGDCLDVLRSMVDNSIDSIVTDPPYGLNFMAKKWDVSVPSVEVWTECLRVLKPGGHVLAFSGTRTHHRMAGNIEDAGFHIRDMIAWVYGSGFPKSHNGEWGGTALKPALEPITMARKPLVGTVAANWLAHGTGGLNIDGCRVGSESTARHKAGDRNRFPNQDGARVPKAVMVGSDKGRWPANLIHDGSAEVLAGFPDSTSGAMKSATPRAAQCEPGSVCFGTFGGAVTSADIVASTGSAARFFYCPKASKASKADRDEGLSEHEDRAAIRYGERGQGPNPKQTPSRKVLQKNHHPTVKPTGLMRHLCRLITPAGGTVCDPYMGSGSTGKAAMLEGLQFIGMEREADYLAIAKARIEHAQAQRTLDLTTPKPPAKRATSRSMKKP